MMNGAVPTIKQPHRARRRRPLQHSFHALTDGSEFTGNGCIFLTVYPTATSTIRYALCGVCEQVSRIAADQRFPLQFTRAVFMLSSNDDSLDGLASLLLTLQQAGAANLTVVGANGTCDKVEGIVDTILHKRTSHPQVRTCEMTSEVSNEWFQVYQDEYMAVHAKSVDHSSVVMVYTLVVDESTRTSFAILPPSVSDISMLSTLPDYVGTDLLDFVLVLNSSSTKTCVTPEVAQRMLRTAPDNTATDDGLLIRAQYHAQQRESFLFPFNSETRELVTDDDSVVTTCSTWHLTDSDKRATSSRIDRESYKKDIWKTCRISIDEESKGKKALSREDLYSNHASVDENEIDLDDDSDIVEDATTSTMQEAHLLVLGTGCASPSPHRGSSGYALFLSEELKVVIECGEGFVTSLRRHLPSSMNIQEQLPHITTIWISHAHLDHYGGLLCLLRAILNAHRHNKDETKRQRVGPPLVVAPRKVLRYLSIMLNDNTNYYEGLTHQEWEMQSSDRLPSMPFHVLQSIGVEHCPNAFALLLVFRNSLNDNNILLCYSGDCRPSLNLINAVHRLRNGISPLSTLLLHEATFDDGNAEMARIKRHSTVSEALWVANEMKPRATILTHFSQRYVKAPPGSNDKSTNNLNYGFCQDGLLLPLTSKAFATACLLKPF
jgi:ribonuclease BN (tRNA processing enzyme)